MFSATNESGKETDEKIFQFIFLHFFSPQSRFANDDIVLAVSIFYRLHFESIFFFLCVCLQFLIIRTEKITANSIGGGGVVLVFWFLTEVGFVLFFFIFTILCR